MLAAESGLGGVSVNERSALKALIFLNGKI
jgi:hypothetical protein